LIVIIPRGSQSAIVAPRRTACGSSNAGGEEQIVRYFRTLTWFLVIAAGAAAALWWSYGRGIEVSAVAASRGTAAEIVYATGTVEPVRWAKVASIVRDRIIEICDCEGKAVRKGDVLARLDDREARAQLTELKAREEFAQRELSRVTELIGRGSATTQAHERASMDLRQIQGLIAVRMEKIADYIIVSPMDGVVLRRDGEIGEIADAGQVLFRVGVPKPLRIVAEVNEEDIPRVVVGQKTLLRTDAFPGHPLDGTVSEITPMGDSAAKTYRIRIALPEDTPLKPGMSVEANVVTREQPGALVIPAEAVQGTSVFVINGDRAERRAITIGIRGPRTLEVTSGLSEGERIAVPFPSGLRPGGRVRLVERS
jgi:RND family efflux transporter MFP subunit